MKKRKEILFLFIILIIIVIIAIILSISSVISLNTFSKPGLIKDYNYIKDYYTDKPVGKILDITKLSYDPNLYLSNNLESGNLESLEQEQRGYIIEFYSEPITKKVSDIDKEINQIKMQEERAISEGKDFSSFSLHNQLKAKENSKLKIEKDQLNKLKTEHNLALNDIDEKLHKNGLASLSFWERIKSFFKGLFLTTGFATYDPELKPKREYFNTFNGVALDISKEDAEKLKDSEYVKNVYQDSRVEANLIDSVPLIQKGIPAGKLDEDGNNCLVTGKTCLDGTGVTIAIIDTGIDYTHDDLGNCTEDQFISGNCEKVIGGYDFVNNDDNPIDDYGHGTHVAGIAAGNGILRGVAPNATLYAYKVLDNSGAGYSSDILSAIERSVDPNSDGDFSDKLDIISLSLGGIGDSDDPMSRTIDNIVNSGVIAVIAAGNSGPYEMTIGSPGTSRSAITVGAIDNKKEIASFSSRGPVVWEDKIIIKPDIIAPGVNIYSSVPKGNCRICDPSGYMSLSGTSMATPHVAGAVALIKQINPNKTPDEIKNLIKSTAENLFYDQTLQGAGMIDISQALSYSSSQLGVDIDTNEYFILNKESQINITINNNLNEDFNNVNFTLYFFNGYCSSYEKDIDYCLNKELVEINSTFFNLTSQSSIMLDSNYLFSETNYITLIGKTAINDKNYLQARYLPVKKDGADVKISYLDAGRRGVEFVNKEINFYNEFYNIGTQNATDVEIVLYYYEGYCSTNESALDFCLNQNLNTIYSEKMNLAIYEDSTIDVIHAFTEIGRYTIVIYANDSEDVNLENNLKILYLNIINITQNTGEESYLELSFPGNLTVNETSIVNFTLKNINMSNFTNANFSLYYYYYKEKNPPDKEFLLNLKKYRNQSLIYLDSKLINLTSNNQTDFIMSIKPSVSGVIGFAVLFNSTFDKPKYFFSFEKIAKNNFEDFGVLDIGGYEPIKGKKYCFQSAIMDYGINSLDKNFTLNLFVNNEFKTQLNYTPQWYEIHDEFYPVLCWTPEIEGANNMAVQVVKKDDGYLLNNIREEEKFIWNLTEVNVSLFDSNNNPTSFNIFFEGQDAPIKFSNKMVNMQKKPYVLSVSYNSLNQDNPLLAYGFNHSYSNNIGYKCDFFETLENEPGKYYIAVGDLTTQQKISFNYYSFFGKLSDILKYGFREDLFDLDVVFCSKFDFENKKCLGNWIPASIISVGYSKESNYFTITAISPNSAQAFALIKSDDYFDGDTTEILGVSDYIDNFIVEKDGIGKIEFLKPLNFGEVNQNNLNLIKGMLKRFIRIQEKNILIENSFFNKPATLTFKNISFTNPQILRNNVICEDECSEIVYNETYGILMVNVTGFSEYSIVEGPYCGDLKCEMIESCSSCSIDCGTCNNNENNGRSSGSSGNPKINSNKSNISINNITSDYDNITKNTSLACIPDLNCSFGPCIDNKQEMICVDLNRCEVEEKPQSYRECVSDKISHIITIFMYILLIVIILILILIVILFYVKNNHKNVMIKSGLRINP